MLQKFQKTVFGSVTFGGKTYYHDLYVFPDGSVELRESSHAIERDEIERIIDSGPDIIVIGTGQAGCVIIRESARRVAEEKGVKLVAEITPKAIMMFNKLFEEGKKVASIIHVTC